MKMSRVLVIKEESHSANPDIGLVIPVAHMGDDGTLLEIIPGEFPNGAIFISKGFLNITQQFNTDEIFIINEYHESNDADWESNSRHQKHYSWGNKVERLDRNALVPIINMSLPDITSGFINHDIELPNNHFFIEHIDFLCGPFKASKQDNNWLVSPLTTPSPLQLKTDYIAKISISDLELNNLIFSFRFKGVNKKFIRNLKEMPPLSFEQVDYISDVRLVSYFTKNGFGKGKNPLGKSEAQKLSQGIDEYVKKNKVLGNSERLKRLRDLLAKFLDDSGMGQEIVQEFLADTRDGRLYLDNYLKENKELLLKEKEIELEKKTEFQRQKLEQELKEIERQIISKKQEFENESKNVEVAQKKAKEKIEEIKRQSDEDAHQVLLEKQKELTEGNLSLETQIADHIKEINEFYTVKEKIKDFEALNKEIDYLKRRKQEIDKESRVVEKALTNQKATLESPQLPDKLAEISTLTSLLNGKKKKDESHIIYTSAIKESKIELNKENRGEYIDSLVDSFSNDYGRDFSFDEMSNLVLCLSQSFLTILAGPPGTGKTSTALRVARYLGLTDENSNFSSSNFLNISVGRAWVSGRDILGFYNSLKDTYQPARTGLYNFLKNDNTDDFLKMILLDEANLSSVEHYWSDFLGMCDPEGMNRSIDLGIPVQNERYLKIKQNVRFIATINNDSTTEKLSPRLIDRVPVITLNHNNHYKSISKEALTFDGAINFIDFDTCFNISAFEANFTQEEQDSLNQLIEILASPINRTTAVRVSQRKVNAIKRYCHVANELGGMRSPPLDYAINQHILPLVEGYGSSFRERLSYVEEKLTELEFNLSKSTLKSIIENGDIYSDSYSFF
jgi:DNA polymerase III delta prime subunit/flagellar hook-basal body complex protein FliE